MKLIIAGGREYTLTDSDRDFLCEVRDGYDVTEVVSGKARGADTGGEKWADSVGIPVKGFPADWDYYGKSLAGKVRNAQMARYADAVVLFKGGTGTTDMYFTAKKEGLRIFDRRSVCS